MDIIMEINFLQYLQTKDKTVDENHFDYSNEASEDSLARLAYALKSIDEEVNRLKKAMDQASHHNG